MDRLINELEEAIESYWDDFLIDVDKANHIVDLSSKLIYALKQEREGGRLN